nr:filamentous hemagglutinin N-terminal domain-containing protein [Campylobacter peloridis]
MNVSGNNMHINGNKVNSVIQWGGGFNINKGESVNFGGNSKNYLNIAHGTNKSTIAGVLNASGNNVFLINPNGVIITKTGNINANRFVASTSSMSNEDMNKFANGQYANGKTIDYATFSPVFKANKLGNVVNMGNINANDVLLIGHKVSIDGGNIHGMHNANTSGDALKNPSNNTASKVHLVGNEVNIQVDGIKSNSIIASAYSKGALQQSTTSYYNYGNNIGKLNFTTQEYDNIENKANKQLVTKDKFEKHATIGSDVDWWHFAKGWNYDRNNMRDFFGTYKLTSDIDFGGNQGKNYANYCMSQGQCTSMIIGNAGNNAFNKNFDGQGFTLKNINMDVENIDYAGIFGNVSYSDIRNIKVDYMGGRINGNNVRYMGGFVGNSLHNGSFFSDISIKNIDFINNNSNSFFIGGFAGIAGGNFTKIYIDNINNILGKSSSGYGGIGGFAGNARGNFENIAINSINNITLKVNGPAHAGGFAGQLFTGEYVKNVYMENIKNVKVDAAGAFAAVGGMFGEIGNNTKFDHIYIKGLENIYVDNKYAQAGSYAGSFAGRSYKVTAVFQNIAIEGKININANATQSAYAGGFLGCNGVFNMGSCGAQGGNNGAYIHNVYLYFKEGSNVKAKSYWDQAYGGESYANIFIANENNKNISNANIYHYINDFNKNDYIQDKINIHTYTDETQANAYKDFLSKANTIEKPTITPPTTPDNPNQPSDSDVILASDDVISANDLNKWLGEIFGGNYWVDIKDFKIQGLSEELKQSISFLEALYGQKGMKEILEKIHNDYKMAYSKYDKFKTSKANLLAFINDKLKPLVDSSNNALAQLKTIQEQLKIAITKYNDYVKKINENPSIKNEATLASLKAEVDRLSNLSGELATTIANNQIKLETWQGKANVDSNGHFTIKGKLNNIALTIPNLEKLNNSGGIENDDYQKLSRQIASSQKQTPTFKYEEEETQEIDEAALTQRARTCIVSDNFKTMNPCVVGSY